MAKRKLSELAVEFVVKCRDDKATTYSWEEITGMVNERFNLDMKWQSVYDRYHSYKKNKVALTTSDNKSSSRAVNSHSQPSQPKPPTTPRPKKSHSPPSHPQQLSHRNRPMQPQKMNTTNCEKLLLTSYSKMT